jgi:hypothetical protein
LVEVDDDFLATVERVGDNGVFREIGAERVLVFESDVVVARKREVDVECAGAVGFDIARLVVASYADAFDRLMGCGREHFAIDAAVVVIAIVWCIARLEYESDRGNSKSAK